MLLGPRNHEAERSTGCLRCARPSDLRYWGLHTEDSCAKLDPTRHRKDHTHDRLQDPGQEARG
nr:MAG TPA: hypothetical protein [Caudoviricetes sp.]